MLMTKEELSVKIAEVDGVEIDNVDLAEAGEDKVLQKFTANSSGADHQDPGLTIANVSRGCGLMENRTYLLNPRMQIAQRLLCETVSPHSCEGCVRS